MTMTSITDTSPNVILAPDEDLGFPAGYFVLRNTGSDRMLDVEMGKVDDGVEILLFPEKEKSLVEEALHTGFRDRTADNQVFFIDDTGALCSRSSGHAVDVKGDRLVLRHRKPTSYPYPNRVSHPLPKFRLNQHTGEITVHFQCDPTYPRPGEPTSEAWRAKTYVLASVPLRKPRTVLDDASAFLTTNIFRPLEGVFTGGLGSAVGRSTAEEVQNASLDLGDDEVLEEDRAEENEVDDSPEMVRRVRVVGIADKDSKDKSLGGKTKKRRMWVAQGLRRSNARTGGI